MSKVRQSLIQRVISAAEHRCELHPAGSARHAVATCSARCARSRSPARKGEPATSLMAIATATSNAGARRQAAPSGRVRLDLRGRHRAPGGPRRRALAARRRPLRPRAAGPRGIRRSLRRPTSNNAVDVFERSTMSRLPCRTDKMTSRGDGHETPPSCVSRPGADQIHAARAARSARGFQASLPCSRLRPSGTTGFDNVHCRARPTAT